MSECVFCGVGLSGIGRHVCQACGAPQPIAPTEDLFGLLDAPRGFSQDVPALERRFYEVSRILHPDRFAAHSDPKWRSISLDRMSAVNRAYQTLTKKDSLRDYLLELEGVRSSKGSQGGAKATIPADLAEEWFDLQDAVMDEPESALERLDTFGEGLRNRLKGLQEKISSLEADYDSKRSSEALVRIEKLLLDRQYLKSMERDLSRLKARLGI